MPDRFLPTIQPVFETRTSTFQYVVADPETKNAAISDPVLDYDKRTRTITTSSADALLSLTHAHADHLTAAFYLQRRLSEHLFGQRYGIDAVEYEGVFEELLEDDQQFNISNVRAQAIHLPGHTPDHMDVESERSMSTENQLAVETMPVGWEGGSVVVEH
ncbi:hypothetical protein B0T18DRAFT_435333 [Schizothecium vesticola]|uniref:Metallo-beta-lactamase domain-containing protein n=1 Tax=Schizothecium vesticola TaxID=314040 RepID=A0AA40FCD6_9PEZI|nr:hypothetical protein B0T18DRAFT_435333 [Schizothecium vesticola]